MQPFDFVILKFDGHIEFAAHAVGLLKRVQEEFGPVRAYLGYSPDPTTTAPWNGPEDEFSRSYYWKTFLGIPFFLETIGSSKWIHARLSLKAVSSTAFSLLRAVIHGILGGRNAFFRSLRVRKVRGLSIGPAVLSDYLRRDYLRGHSGFLKFDMGFVRIMYVCHRHLHYWLDVCPQQEFSRVLFSCPETTYRDDIVRQALLSRGAKEVFMHPWSNPKFCLWGVHREGWELNVARSERKNLRSEDVAEARQQLAKRLSGEFKYFYMHTDVSNETIVDPSKYRVTDRPQAVVYLHLVSDAQHAFGPDCFNDLDHWFRTTVKLLRRLGFRTFLKLHPNNLSPRISGDAQYKAHLEDWLGVRWDDLTHAQVVPTRHSEIFMIDYRVPVREMIELLDPFLCVTHHGTIATEATAVGLPTIMSNSGPYRYFPRFAFIYDSIDRYEALLEQYVQGRLEVTSEMESNLYNYLASTSQDYSKWLSTAFGKICGRPYYDDPESTARFLRSIANEDSVPDILRSGFGGLRSVVNIDGIDWVRCEALA